MPVNAKSVFLYVDLHTASGSAAVMGQAVQAGSGTAATYGPAISRSLLASTQPDIVRGLECLIETVPTVYYCIIGTNGQITLAVAGYTL